MDYSFDIKKDYSYTDQKINYVSFLIYYYSTGQKRSIIVDKKTGKVYTTQYYDSKAIGDSIRRESIDFPNKKAIITDTDSLTHKDYTISLQELINN